MSVQFKLDNDLVIHVVSDIDDPLLTKEFYSNLYNHVFIDKDNNNVAGIIDVNSIDEVKRQIHTWLIGTSKFMFFLYNNKDIVGTTQAFTSSGFDEETLSLGYIVSPKSQGKGYGTIMLKFVSEYLHYEQDFAVVLGFRDGNVASERIAAKNNYTYLMRTSVGDQYGITRPMTFYKYQGKPTLNESYEILPKSKIMITNQWVDNKIHIMSRVNPKMLNLEEYVYLSTSCNKPISLNETYFVFTSAHYNLSDKLKKQKIRNKNFAITDRSSKKMFDPATYGDIVLNEFCDLVDSDLDILQINEDKTSMILGNEMGEIKVNVLGNVLIVEEFNITNK